MSPTPGTIVNVTTASIPNSPPSSIGTAFFIGQAATGPVGVAVAITSLTQYIAAFGARTANGATQLLYDAVDTFFQEGGQLCYISRVSGSTAVIASHTFVDRAGSPLSTLVISALGPGTYGNSIQVAVANGSVGNSFVLTITGGASGTEVSPNLLSPTDAVNWAQQYSKTVTIANSGSVTAAPNNNPAVVSATSLSGGTDDIAPADSVWVTALTAFPADLGPGQVAAPGRTTQLVWQGLVTHGQAANRFALLDGENIATAATILTDAGSVTAAVPDASYGYMLVAYPVYAGAATGTATPPFNRTVAPSGPVAGVMARQASSGNNGDVVAGANNGILQHAVGVSQTYVFSDRGTLEAAGVCDIRVRNGNVMVYGATTLSADPNWSDVGNVRLRMQIINGARIIGDGYVFADIDGQGHTAAAFGGQLAGDLLTPLFNQGALYGATPSDAFTVNVGASINTPTTALARQLLAQINCRMSPSATQVIIDVTRFPVTSVLPAI